MNGGKHPYRIGVVSAMWQRLELTDMVFGHIAEIRKSIALVMELLPVVAGSEGEKSWAVAEKNGFGYIEVENQPLGAKWNAALSLLRNQDVDGVVILGSDDLLNEQFFHVLKRILDEGCLLAGLDTFFVLEGRSGRLMEWLGYLPPREGESIGAGRFLHRELLERLNWHLWEDGLSAGLDASMWRLLRADAARRGSSFSSRTIDCRAERVVLVDVKSSIQINGLEGLALASGRIRMVGVPREFLEEYYTRKLVNCLFSHFSASPEGRMPDVRIDTLEIFASPSTNEPPLCVLVPRLPVRTGEFAEQQRISLLTWLRVQGYHLEVWTEEPAKGASFKIDSGLTGQPVRGLSNAMRSLPSSLRQVLLCGGWSHISTPISIIRRLRRMYAGLHVIADLRFSDRSEAEHLSALTDTVLPCSGTENGRTLAAMPLCVPDRRIPFVDFALRDHAAVFMEHENAMEDAEDIARACVADASWKLSGQRLYLAFSVPMADPAPQWGLYACKSDNMQIFYRIFKVCIIPPRCDSPGICAEILAAGTPLLCQAEQASKMGLSEENGVLAFSSWEEGLRLTRLLCSKCELWTRMAEKAWETGKRLVRASDAMYSAAFGSDGSCYRVWQCPK